MKNYDRLGEQFCNCSDSPSCYANIADTTAPTTHRNTIDRPSSSAFFLLPRSHCIFSIFPPCAARECCIRSARVVPMHFCPVMQINFTLLFFNYDNCCILHICNVAHERPSIIRSIGQFIVHNWMDYGGRKIVVVPTGRVDVVVTVVASRAARRFWANDIKRTLWACENSTLKEES